LLYPWRIDKWSALGPHAMKRSKKPMLADIGTFR
jgi:hypothetical protein